VGQGRLHKGDLVLIVTVGAGYTTGGVLLRWAYNDFNWECSERISRSAVRPRGRDWPEGGGRPGRPA